MLEPVIHGILYVLKQINAVKEDCAFINTNST